MDDDLDTEAHYWAPIEGFTGVFDGNVHTLSGILVQNICGISTFYNNGGGITGVFQYRTIGITSLIYGRYNSGTVSSTGLEEQIGCIAGDASYLIDEYNAPTCIRNTYYSTVTVSIECDFFSVPQPCP